MSPPDPLSHLPERSSAPSSARPLHAVQDGYIGEQFNSLMQAAQQEPSALIETRSKPEPWAGRTPLGREITGHDACGRPQGLELAADVSAWSYECRQPNAFPPVLLRRGWESGVDVGPENEERFNQSLRAFGIPRATEILRYDLGGVADGPVVDEICRSVAENLRGWVDVQLADSAGHEPLDLLRILRKTCELTESYFDSHSLYADPSQDREAKRLGLALLRDEVDSIVLIASTDGTWKTKRWMSVGNDRLGRDLGEKAAERWGIRYGWTNLDPYTPDPTRLAQRLEWWSQAVSKISQDPVQLAYGCQELLRASPTGGDRAARAQDLQSLSPRDSEALVHLVQERLHPILSGLRSADRREVDAARERLADYLVSLSNSLNSDERSEQGRADLLAHAALGSVSRVVLLGSLHQPALSARYEVDRSRSFVRAQPFNGDVEISVQVAIHGPAPSDGLRSEVFTSWVRHQLTLLNGADFRLGDLTYNSTRGVYEIALSTSFRADSAHLIGRRLAIQVPPYLYGFASAAPTGPQTIWSLSGYVEPFSPVSKAGVTVTPWEEKHRHQTSRTETTYPYLLRANLGLDLSPVPRFGGSASRPFDWYFTDFYHRNSDTRFMLRDLGYYFGSPTLYHEPLTASYLIERLPPADLLGRFLDKQAGWPASPSSLSQVSRAADSLFESATKTFLLTGRPDLAGLSGPFPYNPSAQPDYSNLDLARLSMPLREAWRAYYHVMANLDAQYKSTDPALQSELRQDSGRWAQYGAQAVLAEFFPNASAYKALGIVSDFVGKDAFNALREQSLFVGEYHTPTREADEHRLELFLGYHPGLQASIGSDSPTRLSSALTLPIAGLEAKFWNVFEAAAHYSWTHRFSEHWSTQLHAGLGAIISDGDMSMQVGTYSRDGYSFAFREKGIPALPLLDLRGQIRYEGKLSELSSISSTWTLQPSYWHYYQAAKGLWATASALNHLGGGSMSSSLDSALSEKGLDYARLYTPYSSPLNLQPLPAGQLAGEFAARGIQLDAEQLKRLEAPGAEITVSSKNGAGQYRVRRNKEGAYNIYTEYDFSNPAFASKYPLTRHQLDFMTSFPLRSIGTAQATLSQVWNYNALDLERLSLSVLFTFSNPSIPSVQLGLDYLNPARRGIYQFNADLDWKPLETMFDEFWARLRVHPYLKYAWFPTSDTPWLQGPGGCMISGGLRLSFELAPPKHTEIIDTHEWGQSGTNIRRVDCNGAVSWERTYDAPWSRTTTETK